MLSRDYVSVEPHDQFPGADTDSTSLRAETYQGLVNAILYLVSQGEQEGIVRLYNYTRDVEADLAGACLEVAKEDPLGAYAVDYIKFDYTRIVSYYEASLSITYRRTPEQIKSVVSVTGSSAIKGELRESLTHFAPETVLRVSYITEDESYILGLVQDAYYSAPQAAFGLPSVTISLYPDSGYRRIVELELTYPDRVEVLQQKQRRLLDEASGLLTGLPADAQDLPLQLWALVHRSAEYQPNGAQELGSAYAALVEGRADSEGLALTCKLLCDLTETESLVVVGTLDGERHVWNLINTDEGWRHTSAAWEDPAFLTDSAMLALGYAWDAETIPAAIAPGMGTGMEVNMETGKKALDNG